MPRPAPVMSQVFVMSSKLDPRMASKGVLRTPLSPTREPRCRRARASLRRVDRRREIREFLMSRRARVTPDDAGLYVLDGDVRRVPGLRREEVADLAGVSAHYYTQLERGAVEGASDGVLNAVARALGLDDGERLHLFDVCPPGSVDTPGAIAWLDPPGRAADPRRVHSRHGPRAQPPLGLPPGQQARPGGA